MQLVGSILDRQGTLYVDDQKYSTGLFSVSGLAGLYHWNAQYSPEPPKDGEIVLAADDGETIYLDRIYRCPVGERHHHFDFVPFEKYLEQKGLRELGINIHDGLLSTDSQTVLLTDIQRIETVSKGPLLLGFPSYTRLVVHCPGSKVIIYEAKHWGFRDNGAIWHWMRYAKAAIERALSPRQA